jgi:hypothetical protein
MKTLTDFPRDANHFENQVYTVSMQRGNQEKSPSKYEANK